MWQLTSWITTVPDKSALADFMVFYVQLMLNLSNYIVD